VPEARALAAASALVRFVKVVPKSIIVVGLGAAFQACGRGGGGDGVATVPPGEAPALGTGVGAAGTFSAFGCKLN